MKTTAVAVALVIQVGMTGLSQADTYMWTDKSGNVHFSDHPPESESSKRIEGTSIESLAKQASQLAEQWLDVRCDRQAAKAIQRQYEQLRTDGALRLQECIGGKAKSCQMFGISFSEAQMQKEDVTMHKYLPRDFGIPRAEMYQRNAMEQCARTSIPPDNPVEFFPSPEREEDNPGS